MKDLSTYFKESVSEKRILITGGSTGIGREIAILLASLGARCAIFGRHQQQIDETIAAVEAEGGKECIGIQADIAIPEDIQKVFDLVDTKLGGIDILINNAALSHGGILEGKYEDWQYIVQANLVGSLACSHEAAIRMKNFGKGHIINIGSMSALTKEGSSSVYVATKSGLQGFTEALRKELNPLGIKVNLIEPGAVDTDMQEGSAEEKKEKIEKKEMLKAEDIAIAVLFCLAQPERSDIVTMQIRPHLQVI